jgi:hypothetical protein
MAATVKNTVVQTAYEYLRSTYGETQWTKVLEKLSDEDRALVEHADKAGSFPVATDGRVLAAFVDVQFAGSRTRAASELRKGGVSQADAMLDGMFSVFARFVSPQQAFNRAGSIITSVYSSDITARTELAENGNGGAIHIMGMGESSYVSPWQCGWMERALERFGGQNAKVTERSWDAGQSASDHLIYDVSWE